MASDGRKYHAAVAALDAIYRQLPTVECTGGCAIACGPIPLTDVEARRLQQATHKKPRTIALVPVVDSRGDTRRDRCVYLTEHERCSVHAIRPLICRVFGVVKRMSCMRGCVPSRWLTDREFLALAQAVERIGGGRLLMTAPDELLLAPGGGFGALDERAGRSDEHVNADAERTRSLRALHGGRIIAAVSRDR